MNAIRLAAMLRARGIAVDAPENAASITLRCSLVHRKRDEIILQDCITNIILPVVLTEINLFWLL